MKTMKRILTLLLALTLVLGMAVPVFAADIVASGTCGENLTWDLDCEGILTISGTGVMGDNYYPAWSDYCNSIKTVVIEKGVTSISRNAFYGCTSLTSITIPESVTSIGDYVFAGCTGMEYVTIPDSVTTIGNYVFAGCTSLTSISIPDSVTSIGDCVFNYCISLNGIYVDHNNQYYCNDGIGILFTKDKTKLIQAPGTICGRYVIPNTVSSIASYAFYACSGLTSITIPDSVTVIDWAALAYCNNLSEVIFTGDAPSIDNNTFPKVTATVYYPVDNATWTEVVRQNYGGNLTWIAYSKIPKPNKIVNVVSGIHVYWNNVPGVAKYGLWRSENGINGTYKWIANPTVPHFTDTKVESGKTYYYKVTTMDGSGKHSAKSSAIGVTYVSTPDISARYNKAAGVKLDWKKVPGATGYAVYRKSYSGTDAWVRVATISGNATFTWTDTSVKNNNGTAYKYTIRALAGSDMKTLSGCRNAGRSMVRLTSRTLNSAAKASATSIKCSWDASSAVTGYEVRFMVGSTVYKTFTVGDCKVGTKTFTGLKAGQTYKIQIRSYKKIDGMGFYSAWSTAKNVTL